MASSKIPTFRAYPAPGRRVRDPRNGGRPVPGSTSRHEDPEEVAKRKPKDLEKLARTYPRTPYWIRRLRGGDLVEVPSGPAPALEE